MRRVVSWSAACLLAAAALAAYYNVPAAFQAPLLATNRALSGLAEKTRFSAGHTIHYLEGGQGETVILLHGIFAEKDHWVDFARELTSRHHVIAPDLPGYGESGRHAGRRYDYAAQVEYLKTFMDSLGIARAHVAGNSMGGTIGALFALRYPERVASLGFIGAPHGIRSPVPSEMDRLIAAGHAPLVARDAEEFESMLELVFAKRPFLPYPIHAAAQTNAIAHAASNRQLWEVQLRDRYLLQEHVGKLRVRTLALWGSQDRVFDVSGARTLASRFPHAQLQILPGIGHLPMMEAPADSARRYLAFLRDGAAPGGASGTRASGTVGR